MKLIFVDNVNLKNNMLLYIPETSYVGWNNSLYIDDIINVTILVIYYYLI